MTAQDLKNSILQQAIQGKLLPQNPADEPASELLKKISAERQKLIDEGKIKNPPQLPPITDDEKPFDIPESWQWVRLPEIIYTVGGKHNQILAKEIKKIGKYPVISQGQNFIDGYTDEKNKLIYDLPLIMFGDHTRNVKFIDFPFVIGADGTKFLKAIKVCPKYFYWWTVLTAELLRNRGYNRHYKLLKLELFPMPRLAEQKRIVEKLEEILPLIERYGELEQRLTKLDKEFPDKLKKSLLQQAIQGKLTKQLTTDGDAKDLLEKIREEKSKLISEGKIKKEKPLPPISAEEIPFDIPQNWQWVRLGEIVIFENGDRSKKYPTPKDYKSDGIPFWGASDMINNQLAYTKELRFISTKKFSELRAGKLQNKDFVCLLRGAVGKFAQFHSTEQYSTGFINAQMVIMRLIDRRVENFYCNFLRSTSFSTQINQKITGTAIKQMSAADLRNFLIPLPPLAEQKRIVEKLEELLPLCDRLKEKFSLM